MLEFEGEELKISLIENLTEIKVIKSSMIKRLYLDHLPTLTNLKVVHCPLLETINAGAMVPNYTKDLVGKTLLNKP